MKTNDTLKFIQDKVPTGSPYDHKETVKVIGDAKVKSLFSAGVENVRFLERAKKLMGDFLSRSTEVVTLPDGTETTKLKVGSRADFVLKMRDFMLEEGIANPDDFLGSQADLQDITKIRRLQLIFDTNIRQAYGYGRWKQSTHPVVLAAFPAAKFVRLPGAEEKRPRHKDHENDIRLKVDKEYWADFQNDPEIGGFAVSWPPYGFNSYMDQQDVSRKEATSLGLIKEGEKPPKKKKDSFLDGLKADLSKADPKVVNKLRNILKKHKRLKNCIKTNKDK